MAEGGVRARHLSTAGSRGDRAGRAAHQGRCGAGPGSRREDAAVDRRRGSEGETGSGPAAGIEDQRMRFESYFRQETGSVLFLFHDFRETTKNFIDNYGYAKVQQQEEK